MCQLLCGQTAENHSYQFCVEKRFTPALLSTWWIYGPRSGLNRTHTFSKLGSRDLKRITQSKAPRSHLGPPKLSRQAEWQMTCCTAHRSSQSLPLLKILVSWRFEVKSHFKLRKHLAIVQAKKTPPTSCAPPTHLRIFRYDLSLRWDLCFINNCLLSHPRTQAWPNMGN